MNIQAYLSFEGRAEEAINFYQKALGARTEMLMRFKDMPQPAPPGMVPPGTENKVMHASLRIGDTVIMASDGNCVGKPGFQGISLTLNTADEAEARRVFAALGDGGKVQMPLTKTFFSPCFGSVTDPFGVTWMVIVPGEMAAV